MKLLAEISDASLGIDPSFEILRHSFELRKGARAILRRSDGMIALQYLNTEKYHKLPGGGVEKGESLEEALLRELLEEVGCSATVDKQVGVVIEYRKDHTLIQIGYCFIADFIEEIASPTLQAEEIASGMVTEWHVPSKALALLKEEFDKKEWLSYQTPFILKREIAFLEEYVNAYSE
jgi:ADP-ribose pyrophosphatase YjhB (NUDIX family)